MSLVATRLQNWRISNPELDRNMARPLEYGALDFFIEQTDAPNSIISPNLRNRAFASMGNTVQVPVINYDGDVTVSNSRSCTVSDDENTSALYTIVWTTYSVGFTMVPTLYMNNEIDYQHDFERKMEKICRALATALDSAAITALEAAGYKKAAERVIAYGFEELDLHRIEARFMSGNQASLRVAEKLGMTFEGYTRDGMLVKGSYKTIGISAILDYEWRRKNG